MCRLAAASHASGTNNAGWDERAPSRAAGMHHTLTPYWRVMRVLPALKPLGHLQEMVWAGEAVA
jgi:hypothetical protein